MAKNVTGVDMGLRSAKFVRGHYKGNTFHVTDFAVERVASDDIAQGWSAAQPSFKPQHARIGLTGRDVNIRYTRVPRVPDWQLKNLMRFEVEEIGETSGDLASDFNLLPALPEIEGEDVVLLAMARESLLEAHVAGLARVGGSLDSFSPNAIALYNAFLRFGVVQDEIVLLANIGHDNLDVVITRGPDLLFARNLSGGSRLFDDALVQRLSVAPARAAELKETVVDLDPSARFTDPAAEKASRAVLGAAGQLLSLLQSTVLFCKSQIKLSGLKLDRVLICGGGAALEGLPKYLSAGMSVPVELFDPWRVIDVAGLANDKQQKLEEFKLESVVALGLATMASDAEAWSIELVPATVRKKREFLEGTLFTVAAGVLAVGFLGFLAFRLNGELGEARSRAAQLQQKYQAAESTHRRAKELIDENQKLAQVATEMYWTAGSGEQIARAVTMLQSELPKEFWVTQFTSEFKLDPELKILRGEERPVVSIAGKAREGANSLASSYESFVVAMRGLLPPDVTPKERLTPSGSSFALDFSVFAPTQVAAPAADAAEATPSTTPRARAESGR